MEHVDKITNTPKKRVMIIAEAGVNHNGKLSLALKLCDEALKVGADMVKFQTWKTGALMVPEAPLANYQKGANSQWNSQYAMAKALELSFEDFYRISAHCHEIGIGFLSTPDDEPSLNFLTADLGMKLIKIGSGEVTNLLYLSQVAKKRVSVILSTGMSAEEEVFNATKMLRQGVITDLTLLHCTSNYPAPLEEVNLLTMKRLKELFGVPVGYSDHTEGIEIAMAAAALGAEVIEKHLTLDRRMSGPDHKASITPAMFRRMVEGIRKVELALGVGEKRVQPSEEAIRMVVSRYLVAGRPISTGEIFTTENVTAKRTGGKGIAASKWLSVEGTKAHRDYLTDEKIEWA